MFYRCLHAIVIFMLLGSLLAVNNVLAQGEQTGVTAANAILRESPTTNSAALRSLPQGTTVTILGEEEGNSVALRGVTSNIWYHVRLEDGLEGYIWSGLVEVSTVPTPTIAPTRTPSTSSSTAVPPPSDQRSPTPASAGSTGPRPLTGELVASQNLGLTLNGEGTLTIQNGQERDAVVALWTRNDSITMNSGNGYSYRNHPEGIWLAIYVRARDEFTLEHMPDGSYQIYVALGTEPQPGLNSDFLVSQLYSGGRFDASDRFKGRNIEPDLGEGANKYFTTDPAFFRFDDPLVFETTRTTYTTWTITLEPVEGGTAETIPVDPDKFP